MTTERPQVRPTCLITLQSFNGVLVFQKNVKETTIICMKPYFANKHRVQGKSLGRMSHLIKSLV